MANQYDFLDLMKAGGYNPLDGGITTNEMQDFRLQGLINNFNQTNEKIDALNLPPVQEKKSPNILQKIGSAFGQYGMDDRMPADEFLNLPKADRRKMQIQGLQNFANQMNLVGAQQSGNAQRIVQAQNVISQRRAEDEARQKEAQALMQKEQFERQQEEFIKNNPELAGAIRMNQLFGFNMPGEKPKRIIKGVDGRNYYEDGTLVLNNVNREEKKKVKGDFVVDILSKIQDDPTYGTTDNPFSVGDQTILDTLRSVDPLEIYKRDLMNKTLGGIIDNEPKETTTPTVTTQEEFDKLPSGTLYKEEDGNTYRKP